MSTFRGISSVTDALVTLVKQTGLTVTARSPDKARDGISGNQLNIFLYNSSINAAWRNQDLPAPAGTGQPRRPLLPLNLYYLFTAYSSDTTGTSDLFAHEFLGRAMLTVHDKPELRLKDFAPNSGIKNQTDPIRLTLQPLTLDEVSKLWSAFQTPYRPSVAYEVGVVLIESEIPEVSPMPVTSRGKDGTGWDTSNQFPPILSGAKFQTTNQYGARLRETITLTGANLGAYGSAKVSFQHPLRERDKLAPFLEPTLSVTENEVTVRIPDLPNTWPAGVYTVFVREDPATPSRAALPTNPLLIPLLPEIDVPPNLPPTLQAVHDTASKRSLAVPSRPKLMAGQRVQILIGSVEVNNVDVSNPARPVARWDKTIVEIPPNARPLEQPFARLKVDGVDSLVYDPANLSQGFDPRFLVQGLP